MFQEQDKQKKAIKTNCVYFNKLEEYVLRMNIFCIGF